MVAITYRLSRSSLRDYAWSVGPIAAGFIAVPTLACAAGREGGAWWPQLPLPLSVLSTHFTHTSTSISQGRWWTVFTSGVCHPDQIQRDHSVCALLLAGWQPAAAFGPVGTLTAFCGGTALAAINSSGRELQTRQWLDSSTGSMLTMLTPRAAKALNDFDGFWRVCGGGPGVFSLIGADFCLTVERAVQRLREWEDGDARPDEAGALLWLAASLANTAASVLAELRAISSGAALSDAHVGRLTGFGWGVACYLLLRWAKSSRWGGLSRATPGGRSGGRRLGRR